MKNPTGRLHIGYLAFGSLNGKLLVLEQNASPFLVWGAKE